MSKVNAIRVKNLRALIDSGDIELKPLTLLVGKNSVGKSTFARIFPLFRQSVEEKRRAPLLWWGKYVDFGTFNDAVSRLSKQKEITFGFEVFLEQEIMPSWYLQVFGDDYFQVQENLPIYLEIIISTHDGNTYVKQMDLSCDDLSCKISIGPLGIVDEIRSGDRIWKSNDEMTAFAMQENIVPVIHYFKAEKKTPQGQKTPNPLRARVIEDTGNFAHKNTAANKLQEIARNISFIGTAEKTLEVMASTGTPSWKRSISSVSVNDPRLKVLRQSIFMSSIPGLTKSISESLDTFASGVRYLEPLRATAQRFYRPQELAINEIDSKGENLAVFIHSMGPDENAAFNEWLKQHLGFQVFPKREGGHISLTVKFPDDPTATNLADTGFGVSQVLPIATQLWSAISSTSSAEKSLRTTCFVVEQPELHLHPAFQEQLADLFVATLNNAPNSRSHFFPIIAETHSSSLINRLGELVFLKKIKKENVQIVMFEQVSASEPVKVRISSFDDDGVLQNWPYGFFSSGRTE